MPFTWALLKRRSAHSKKKRSTAFLSVLSILSYPAGASRRVSTTTSLSCVLLMSAMTRSACSRAFWLKNPPSSWTVRAGARLAATAGPTATSHPAVRTAPRTQRSESDMVRISCTGGLCYHYGNWTASLSLCVGRVVLEGPAPDPEARPMSTFRSTTILAVRHKGGVALGGDGQVTLGNVVMKSDAHKIRKLQG